MNLLVQCPRCRAWLGEGMFNQPEQQPCPACGVSLQVEAFPALLRKYVPGQAGETILTDGEAGCFYHPQKQAVRPCDGCGRFLCSLCDCELHGQHFCPTCLETGKTRGQITNLDNQRKRYDRLALMLAVVPLILCYVSLVTAPMALYVAIRYWKSPPGLTQQNKSLFIAAVLLAVVEIVGWLVLFTAIAMAPHHSRR